MECKAKQDADKLQEQLRQIWKRFEADKPITSEQAKEDIKLIFHRMRRLEAMHEMENNYVDYILHSVGTEEWEERKARIKKIATEIDEAFALEGDTP